MALVKMVQGKKIVVESGGELEIKAGGTFTLAGTLAYTGNLGASGSVTAGTSLAVTTTSVLAGDVTIGDGYAGTGSTLTAAGAASLKGAVVAAGSITGLKAVLTDSADENAIQVNTNKFTVKGNDGDTLIAGSLALTGGFTLNTNVLAINATTGVFTLKNAMTIDANAQTDVILFNSRVGICGDASPAANPPAGGVTIFFAGGNLMAVDDAGKTATLNNAAFA